MPPDYSGQNLRGRSFKGENLTGANFSKADIRGANFTNAILKNADFTGAKAGLQKRWVIGLLIVSCLLSPVSGYLSIIIGIFTASILQLKNTPNFVIEIVVSLVLMAVFLIVASHKGLIAGLRAVVGVGAIAGAGAIVIAIVIAIVGVVAIVVGAKAIAVVIAIAVAGAGAGAVFGAVAGAVAGAVFGAVVAAVAGAVAGVVAVAGAAAGVVAIAVAVVAAVAGAVAGAVAVALFGAPAGGGAGAVVAAAAPAAVVAIVIAIAFTLFSAYIGWRSLKGNEKDAWVRSFALTCAATGGTNFQNADLTDADFTGATLKNTDFRKANLTRTCFSEATKLDFARLDNTILTNLDVLNLLVTGNGREKSYINVNLKAANLKDADLTNANLKDAYISQATFQGACLEGANLTLTQAVGTDFTSAQMTGACVEAWNIESTTKLDNVDCRFVYLLEYAKPETDDRERRPSSGDFQPGEFTKLFEEVLNTVDLIFRNGIDWKAFVNAFKTVQDQNKDTELALQSIENKGDGVVVKVGVPDGADKEKIHSDFTQSYQIALQAVEEKYKAVLQAKDDEILFHRQQSAKIPEMIISLANKPINVKLENKVENKQMPNSTDASGNFQMGNVGGDFNASGQALNLGEISSE